MSDPKEHLEEAQKELLIRYLDKSLEVDEESDVEHLVGSSAEASCELQELRELTMILRDHEAVYCPDPMELSDYLETGHDPSGTIAEHLVNCTTCQREMDTLRGPGPQKNMPGGLLERIIAELPDPVEGPPVRESRKWFPSIPEKLTDLFPPRWVFVGAAALVLLLVLVMYPRYGTTPRVGVSSVTWNHIGNGLHGGMWGGHALRKPHLAILLLFEDFKKPLPQKAIDDLYHALKPTQEERDRYDVIPPSQLTKIIAENKLQATNVPAILGALKERLEEGEVVLVTVRAADDRFTVYSRLFDAATGRVVAEKTTNAASYAELKTKVRQAAYSVLRGKR